MVDRYSAGAIALIHGDFREKRGRWVKYQDYEKLYQDYEKLEQENARLRKALALIDNKAYTFADHYPPDDMWKDTMRWFRAIAKQALNAADA